MNRRHCLVGSGAAWAGLAAPGRSLAHGDIGPVTPPVAVPNLPVTDDGGRRWLLREGMAGQVTVVQTIFTGCSSVCPIQGALFAQAQRRLGTRAARWPVRWLSFSIDALGDTPQSLRKWLQRTGPLHPSWTAVVPQPDGVDAMVRVLDDSRRQARQGIDGHSDKVYFFDPQARLCWRTGALPSADELVRLITAMTA